MRKLVAQQDGSAAIEFAVAIPVLISMIWGMFQLGMIFLASSGMQHALGEAARYATIFPTPTDSQLQAKITSTKFGLGNGDWSTPIIENDSVAGTKTITVSYSQQMDWLFIPGPTVTLTRSKVIYLAP